MLQNFQLFSWVEKVTSVTFVITYNIEKGFVDIKKKNYTWFPGGKRKVFSKLKFLFFFEHTVYLKLNFFRILPMQASSPSWLTLLAGLKV